MAILEILTYPDPRLKEISKPVEKVDDEIKKLVSDMLETMYDAPGIGLAAPQVGVLKNVIAIDVDHKEEEKGNPLVVINPELVSAEGNTTFEEGCLSVPYYNAEVKRFVSVLVKGLNEEGEEINIETDGLLAIALQHEIDHLKGILFVDRLGIIKRDIFRRKYKKMLKEKAATII